jgi:hypothetical protein
MSTKEQQLLTSLVEEPIEIQDKIVEEDNDSEETLPDEQEEIQHVSPTKVKRKYTKRQPKETIKTSDENVEVVIKTRKKGPRKRVVTVYKEDLPVDPIQIVEKVRRKPGRPKKPVVEVIKEQDEEDCIVFQKPTKIKLTTKELKQMELETRLLELQAVSGNSNLKMNRRGKVDGRQSKVRTQKQLDATAKLVEMNKLRRMKKKDDEKQELLDEQKHVVKNIIGALNQNKVKKVEEDNQKVVKAKEAADKRKKMVAMFD